MHASRPLLLIHRRRAFLNRAVVVYLLSSRESLVNSLSLIDRNGNRSLIPTETAVVGGRHALPVHDSASRDHGNLAAPSRETMFLLGLLVHWRIILNLQVVLVIELSRGHLNVRRVVNTLRVRERIIALLLLG